MSILFMNSVNTLIGYSNDNPILVAVYHTNRNITNNITILHTNWEYNDDNKYNDF